jgi:hypothetical protein
MNKSLHTLVPSLALAGALSSAFTTSTAARAAPEVTQLSAAIPDLPLPTEETTGVRRLVEASGLYFVPTPAELASYAVFPVGEVWLMQSGEQVEITYKLPSLLVGVEQRVSFRGRANAGVLALAGDDGQSHCFEINGLWMCHEAFDQVYTDLDQLAELLQGRPQFEIDARMEVARIFSTDPIGTILFEIAGS